MARPLRVKATLGMLKITHVAWVPMQGCWFSTMMLIRVYEVSKSNILSATNQPRTDYNGESPIMITVSCQKFLDCQLNPNVL